MLSKRGVNARPRTATKDPAPSETDPVPEIPIRAGRFAVVGDLQPTSRLEVWRESNALERELLVDAVRRAAPDFVVLLGDAVFCGSSAAAWDAFDRVCRPLRDADLPVLPILGNHEYWVSPAAGLKRFFGRFPDLGRRHWYARRYGPLGLVFLDSNRRWLSRRQWSEQREWLGRALADFDADASVRGVVVFVHHPPYTNSTVTSDELHVQRDLVPSFDAAAKTVAMIAGHVHSYERFARGGKTFLVAGGGGAPRVRLAVGGRRRHADDLYDGPPLRFFHFLEAAPQPDGLSLSVRGLDKGGNTTRLRESFTLVWPETGERR